MFGRWMFIALMVGTGCVPVVEGPEKASPMSEPGAVAPGDVEPSAEPAGDEEGGESLEKYRLI